MIAHCLTSYPHARVARFASSASFFFCSAFCSANPAHAGRRVSAAKTPPDRSDIAVHTSVMTLNGIEKSGVGSVRSRPLR